MTPTTASKPVKKPSEGWYDLFFNRRRPHLRALPKDWDRPEDIWTLQGCPGKIRQLTWLVGKTTPILAVASGTTIVLWNLNSDATMWEGQLLEGHQDIVTVAIAHPQLPILASAGADGYTCIWSAQGEIEQILTQSVSKFTSLSWHPDRLYLATGSHTGEIGWWEIPA